MKSYPKSEKGIALLIALFALLLLSAVGLSMMFSADAETSINANYRDKQQVTYASLSGALEARDRLQPANTSSPNWIPFPTAAPSTTSQQIWYIVNPSVGETIQPWSALDSHGNPNPYMDSELCHDNILGLSGTAGVPCSGTSSLPSGSGWYKANWDNSSYSGSYSLANPLQYKWTRIQLKTDNSSPKFVGSSPSGKIVCWDGLNQIPLPPGYKNDCTPNSGSVSQILLLTPGTGYTSAPTVTVSAPPSGVTALASPIFDNTPNDKIGSVTVDNPGSGYTSQPLVTITGDGIGATAIANIYGGTVTSVTLTDAGTQCYLTPPSVSFSGGGGGTGATATAVLGPSTCVYSISGGTCNVNGWKGNTMPVSLTGGNSDFSASVTFKHNGDVDSVTINSPGTGYSSPPVQFTSGGSTCLPGSTITVGSHVATITVTNGGSGYTSNPTAYVAPQPNYSGTGATQPTATASIGAGVGAPGTIANIVVTNPGSGYSFANVTITGGGGMNGAATAVLGTNKVLTGIKVDNGGSGYMIPPTVTISGPGGSGATAKAYLTGGAYYGQVLTLTSLALSKSNARAMTQMEVATPPRSYATPGALTLAGPSPTYIAPNSSPFTVNGNDLNSCGDPTANPAHPAVGVFDNPDNPTSPTAQASVIAALPQQNQPNYIGAKPAPDIENVYSSLGDNLSTPAGLDAWAQDYAAHATAVYGNNPAASSVAMGTPTNPTITVVNGSLDLSGSSVNGYGILLVTGTLSLNGNFNWHGAVLVIGQGICNNGGGGNGQVIGTLLVAKTRDASGNLLQNLGSPYMNWNGGGGNGIKYDHCWADAMLGSVQHTPPPTTLPIKILSTRAVSY